MVVQAAVFEEEGLTPRALSAVRSKAAPLRICLLARPNCLVVVEDPSSAVHVETKLAIGMSAYTQGNVLPSGPGTVTPAAPCGPGLTSRRVRPRDQSCHARAPRHEL